MFWLAGGVVLALGISIVSVLMTLHDRRVYKRWIKALQAEIEMLKCRYQRLIDWIRRQGIEPPDWVDEER